MSDELREPRGSLLLRTLAMPADTNPSGDIFGGWLMSQMDIGGAILANELAQGRVVTVAVDAISFLRPVAVGDVVCCYGFCSNVGRTSLKVKMEVWVKKVAGDYIGERYCVTEATYTYVAVDGCSRPRLLPRENNPGLNRTLNELAQENGLCACPGGDC